MSEFKFRKPIFDHGVDDEPQVEYIGVGHVTYHVSITSVLLWAELHVNNVHIGVWFTTATPGSMRLSVFANKFKAFIESL